MDHPVTSSFSLTQFQQILGDPNYLILDVRREPTFAQTPILIPGAVRCPPDQLENFLATLNQKTRTEKKMVVYCVYGHEVSQNAAQQCIQLGWPAFYLAGSYDAWLAANK